MVPSRRRLLQAAGTATAAALAGCSADVLGDDPTAEYALDVDAIDASPVEYALYEPSDDELFGAPARTALDAILPDGRHTTYGYAPLPEDAFVEHDGTYYQTEQVVTGRKRLERPLVRVEPVAEDAVPDDAVLVDALDQPSARPLKILHSYAQTDGETSTADLLRGDAYVMRRPAELDSRLVTGDLDGRVVTMTDSGTWAYRVEMRRERVVETAHTALAIEVAASREQFREVVFGTRIDVDLAPGDLPAGARSRLDRAIERRTYTETTPLSDGFDALLSALGLAGVDSAANGRLLWYDGRLHRYGLYVDHDPE
ncbi:hypothetical protein [Halorarius halobius]|uniref:hypothetical protein n=1 Tax=Halorarius halobius TaxID=2962671 RepID=UPI0020CF473F|nr:hypothetical protein [Halorarius halobius]